MRISSLIKVAPSAVLLAYVAYACVSLQGALPDAAAKQDELAKGLDQMLKDLAIESAAALKTVELRDPFIPVLPPATTAEAAMAEASEGPRHDELADLVAGLSLDATFIQGRDQLAIIGGRTYKKGQPLVLPGKDSLPPLVVTYVKPTSVILHGGGKNYVLGYPETLGKKREKDDMPGGQEGEAALSDPAGQAAMFRALLNSPLGAMGRGLIGIPGPSSAGGRKRTTRNSAGPR